MARLLNGTLATLLPSVVVPRPMLSCEYKRCVYRIAGAWPHDPQQPNSDPVFAYCISKFPAFINSTSWEPLKGIASLFSHLGNVTTDGSATFADSQLITTVNEQHVVQMVIDNLDDGDHPFHLHGQKFWIVGQGDGRFQGQTINNTLPMLRDTLVIPAYTHAVLRFTGDNPGFWAFHCHIQWHMCAGHTVAIW
ncbi:Cupredoxin [Dichomitus squalens]|nr:Cupredoxin [Dichomitus squalens]